MPRREVVFAGTRFRVERVEIPARDGGFRTRELVIHPGAVVIAPIFEDGESIEPERVAWDEALAMCRDGTIEDGKTLATLLYLAAFGRP